jgi:hypothetical protein
MIYDVLFPTKAKTATFPDFLIEQVLYLRPETTINNLLFQKLLIKGEIH